MLYNKHHTLKLIHNLVCADYRHGETNTATVQNMSIPQGFSRPRSNLFLPANNHMIVHNHL